MCNLKFIRNRKLHIILCIISRLEQTQHNTWNLIRFMQNENNNFSLFLTLFRAFPSSHKRMFVSLNISNVTMAIRFLIKSRACMCMCSACAWLNVKWNAAIRVCAEFLYFPWLKGVRVRAWHGCQKIENEWLSLVYKEWALSTTFPLTMRVCVVNQTWVKRFILWYVDFCALNASKIDFCYTF